MTFSLCSTASITAATVLLLSQQPLLTDPYNVVQVVKCFFFLTSTTGSCLALITHYRVYHTRYAVCFISPPGESFSFGWSGYHYPIVSSKESHYVLINEEYYVAEWEREKGEGEEVKRFKRDPTSQKQGSRKILTRFR